MLKSKPPNIIAGKDDCYFPNEIYLKGKVTFGNYCAIGENLRVISRDHNYHLPTMQVKFYLKNFKKYPGGGNSGRVEIGNDVWIGDNVIILKCVKIGNGACIGAGSVVTKDIPPYAVAAGVPAKVISYRFNKKTIRFLSDLNWWDWSESKIRSNKKFFNSDLSKIKDLSEIKKLIK